MPSDELSFEDLGKAFARAMRGGSTENNGTADSENKNHSSDEKTSRASEIDDWMDIPDELYGDDFPVDENEGEDDENAQGLAMYDANKAEERPFGNSDFRSFTDEIDDDRIVPVTPAMILEAMLFVGNPVNAPAVPEILSNLMRGVSVTEIHELVKELNARYEADGCPWEIAWFEEEKGYFMQLRETFEPLRENFYGKIRQAKLSQAAIDTLAIIAYEQPLSLDEINEFRGASSASILAQLVRRQLLRTQKVRRGTKFLTVYYTTERFLKLFELESLSDLPQSEDLDRE